MPPDQVFGAPSADRITSPIGLLWWPIVYNHVAFRQSCVNEVLLRTMQLAYRKESPLAGVTRTVPLY